MAPGNSISAGSPPAHEVMVTHKGFDADGPYYDLQIAWKGEIISARHHVAQHYSAEGGSTTGGNVNGGAAGAQGNGNVGGSSNTNTGTNSTQSSGSVPVSLLDPARKEDEEPKKVEVDPQALKAAIERFETQRMIGLGAYNQPDEPEQQQGLSKSSLFESLFASADKSMPDPERGNYLTPDLSFLRGTGFSQGVSIDEFSNNLANTTIDAPQRGQGPEIAPPKQELPAHVKQLAVAAVGRLPVGSDRSFDGFNGALAGLDFSHKNVIPATRAPAQVRMLA